MTPRENLTTALQGGLPEHTPLSVLHWLLTDPRPGIDEWRPLFDQGLALALQCLTVRLAEHGVKTTVEHRAKGDRRYTVRRKETPVGTVQSVTVNSIRALRLLKWPQQYWVKTPADHGILRWIVERTEVLTQNEAFGQAAERAGDRGVVVPGGRSPAMSIQIDYAGWSGSAIRREVMLWSGI